MKILQINNEHRYNGGAHTVYFNTAELLKNNGHEVFFFSQQQEKMLNCIGSELFPPLNDFRSMSVPEKIKNLINFCYNRAAYRNICKYIDLIKPDIAHVHLFMGGLSVSILKALKEKNIPIVHTVHDYRLICPAYTFLDSENKICEKCRDHLFLRCTLKKCSLENKFSHSLMLSLDAYFRKFICNPLNYIDLFIFVSNFSRNLHGSYNLEYIKKSYLLYNFTQSIQIEEKPEKERYYLFFGRLSREKGLNLLVDIISELGLKLKIVGKGPLFNSLSDKKNTNIEVLGFKNGNELKQLIANAYFVIVPSEWYENNPLSILESFALKKPVIGSYIGGIKELLEDERGLIFQPGNRESLSAALTKAENMTTSEYNLISKNAYNFSVAELSENEHYNKLIKIYKEVINAKINY